MREVGEYIDRTFRLGALGTGRGAFYERLGWVAWKGPTSVHTDAGLVRTPRRTAWCSSVDPDVPGARPVGTDQLRLAAR